MTVNIREIINNLIREQLATMAYYDHEPTYHHLNRVEEILQYDSDFHTNFEPCILFAGHGDYAGSTIDMANMRYVEKEYPELIESGHITYQNQGYGYTCLVIFFLRLPVARSGLLDDLENLPDYCLLDDELDSVIQDELLEEAWDNWVRGEFESEIDKRTGCEFEETDWQEGLFWNILRNSSNECYHPEGTDIYVNMEQVFRDSESLIEVIQKNVDNLESGEFEITGDYRSTGYDLMWDHDYTGQTSYEERQEVFNIHKGQKIDFIPESILQEFGLKWFPVSELFWEVKPINEVLKNIVKAGLKDVTMLPYPVKPNYKYEFQKHNICANCHDDAVCQVNDVNLCPDCYNKLMGYYPKCVNCQEKNVSASLQLTILPELEDITNLTHCQDCKNLLVNI